MGELVDIQGKLEERQHVEAFARLLGIAQEAEAEILKDPIPHLREASQRIGELEEAVEETIHALFGTVSCVPDFGAPPKFTSISAEQHNRITTALDLLRRVSGRT